MATAQKEPSLIQKDLLARKLVDFDSYLPEAEELDNTAIPRLEEPDRLFLRSLPGLPLHERVAPTPIENRVGSIISQKSLPCLPLHEMVAPTPAISDWVGAAASEAGPLLEL